MAALRLDQARRIALAAQGFAERRPQGRIDVRHLRRVLRKLDLVQIDAVSAVERAQYVPFFSRLGPYPARLLDDLAYRRRALFEAWAHEASLVVADRWPALRHRDGTWVLGRAERLEAEYPGYGQRVLSEIEARGPLTVAELADPGSRDGPWWGWSKGKIAVEVLFARGQLAVAERRGGARVYDLSERVIPPDVYRRPPLERDPAYRELLLIAARAHGVGTADDLADYYRLHVPTARRVLKDLVAAGLLETVEVQRWRWPAYRSPAARLPRRVDAAALLAPFDPLVWHRPRLQRLFGFDYRLEFYVPASKRRYGYYVMPFLLGDALVARVDLKADRRRNMLAVLGAWIEPDQRPSRVAPALSDELHALAGWLGLGKVEISTRGTLAGALQAAADA